MTLSEKGTQLNKPMTLVLAVVMLSGCSTIQGLLGSNTPAPATTAVLPETQQAENWYCYPEDTKNWDCVDKPDSMKQVSMEQLVARTRAEAEATTARLEKSSKSTSAPVPQSSELPLAPQVEKTTAEMPKPIPSPAIAVENSANSLASRDDLLSQPADFYTVQLLARRDESALINYAKTNGLPDPLYTKVRSQRDDWFVLLLGIYPDKQTAERAKTDWVETRTLKVEPWVRRLGPLQDAMKEVGAS